jgi:diguanylate cyclase (GGDEF)-like protein
MVFSALWPKPFRYFRHIRLFLIILSLLLSVLVGVFFAVLYQGVERGMLQRLEEQANAYADLVNHIKMWNYDFGGVFIEKKRGDETNAHLLRLGINPDLHTSDGRTLTVRNHAIMVHEISKRSEQTGGGRFRIISGKPIDPHNAPDALEAEALAAFAGGTKRFTRLVLTPAPLYRFVQPMIAEKSCLECHGRYGYKVGDVLGALSVTLPVAGMMAESRDSRVLIVIGGVVVLGIILLSTYFLTLRLAIKLDEVQLLLRRQASTDELTGLRNRRNIMKRLHEEFLRAGRKGDPLSLIIVDIDHFKKVNDAHGHPFGDIVLKHVAITLRDVLRNYDIIGRIGGEEFMVITPVLDLTAATALADRLRLAIAGERVSEGGVLLRVTVSAGVATIADVDDSVQALIKRADMALYKAKLAGRNQVATCESTQDGM